MKEVDGRLRPGIFRIGVALTLFVAAFIFCTVYFRSNIVPTVMGSAVAEVRAMCTETINSAVTAVVGGGVEYDDLFSVVRDDAGNIEMVQANSPEINMVAREIAGLAQANLDALDLKEISIPIGTFTGLALLTGLGPDVTISVMPIGSALCDFVSYFVAAGINQTLHKIYIDVHAEISIITPLDEPAITVKAEVLVAENLIVGEVPEFYFGGSMLSGGYLDLTP